MFIIISGVFFLISKNIDSMKEITFGLFYEKKYFLLDGRIQIVHVIKYSQKINKNLDFLISKVSEAINPYDYLNHIGEQNLTD